MPSLTAASLQTSKRVFSAIAWYDSYSSLMTFLPSKLSLVVPMKVEVAPAAGDETRSTAWFKDSGLGVIKTLNLFYI